MYNFTPGRYPKNPLVRLSLLGKTWSGQVDYPSLSNVGRVQNGRRTSKNCEILWTLHQVAKTSVAKNVLARVLPRSRIPRVIDSWAQIFKSQNGISKSLIEMSKGQNITER